MVLNRRLGTKLEEDMLPFLGAAWMSGLLGGLGLLMAAVGLYGVMSFSVRQRTREIGIRIALGATAERVVGLFLRQGMRHVAIGAVIGLGGTVLFLLSLAKFWFGFGTMETGNKIRDAVLDPIAYAVVTLILTAVALVACWLPARRAAKVDPMVALRCE
jgi:putative ABC transport system permease protein